MLKRFRRRVFCLLHRLFPLAFPVPGHFLNPPEGWCYIEPDDHLDLKRKIVAISMPEGGSVAVVLGDGTEFLLCDTPPYGFPFPVAPVRVKATGTTAPTIVGHF